MDISVIICTHTPREDYLRRTLEALKQQTLPQEQWELLLIDNASKEPLAGEWDLSWHPHGRHVLEDELGLTPARLRGIREANGEFLVFVDDDNLLAPLYLENCKRITTEHPYLGVIGGQILPEYDTVPPPWLLPYERIFAIRRVDMPRWSNAWDDWQSQPWGAGMAAKREVCLKYSRMVSTDERRKGMDRKGQSLFSGGDTDMVMTCIDFGLGFGVFPELVVTHLIPPSRMEKDYVLRLVRGLMVSNLWLKHLHGQPWELSTRSSWYTHLRGYYHFLNRPGIVREIEEAGYAGQRDFLKMLEHEKGTSISETQTSCIAANKTGRPR